MTRTGILSLVVCATLWACGSAAWGQNVVFFLVDDMGAYDWEANATLNPNGSVLYETPNMVRLAQEGVTFNQAYASAPVCSPTRASLMTGKTAPRHRITEWISGGNHNSATLTQPTNWIKNLPDSEVTLAEMFKSNGYNTGFVGKWHLGQNGNAAADPLNHGFDSNIGGNHKGSPPGGYFAGGDGGWSAPGLNTGTYNSDDYLTDALTDFGEQYITDHANQSEPFFLMMSHYAVHNPKQAPQSLVDKYNQKKTDLQNQGIDLQGHTNATYAGMVEKMDDSLGRLLDRLEDPNNDGDTSDSIRDDTIVIFTSDHGGLFAAEGGATDNRPLRDGKGSLYEGGMRVPFIVSHTGNAAIAQGTVNENDRVSSEDLYVTLEEMTGTGGSSGGGVFAPGAPVSNADQDGVSFKGALEGQAHDRRYQYWHYRHWSNQDFGSNQVEGGKYVSGIRNGDWKLIWSYDSNAYELYNVVGDVGETTNLINASNRTKRIAYDLSLELNRYLGEVNAQMPISLSTGQPVALPAVVSLDGSVGNPVAAHYTLDDASGPSITDSGPSVKHGAAEGTPNYNQAGIVGSAMRFDGSSEAVAVSNGLTDLGIDGNNAKTVALWFNADTIDGNQSRLIGMGDWGTGTASTFDIVLEDSGTTSNQKMIGLRYGNGNSFYLDESDAEFQTGQWYHVIFSYDGTTLDFDTTGDGDTSGLSVYVNGVQVDADAGNQNNTGQSLDTGNIGGVNTDWLFLGREFRNNTGQHFDGFIDDVQIYNRGINPAQAAYLFNNPGTLLNENDFGQQFMLAINPVVARYTLDETSGSTAFDSGPNGKDGTLTPSGITQGSPGIVDRAYDFDGASGGVAVSNGLTDLGIDGNNAKTVALWFNADTIGGGEQRLIGMGDWGAGFGSTFDITLEDNSDSGNQKMIGLRYGNGNAFFLDENDAEFQAGQWYHVVFSYDGTFLDFDETTDADTMGLSVYVNGVQVEVGAGNMNNLGQFLATGDNGGLFVDWLYIGQQHQNNAGEFFDGLIDDVQIYNMGVSPEQAAYLFNNPGALLVAGDFNRNGFHDTEDIDLLADHFENTLYDLTDDLVTDTGDVDELVLNLIGTAYGDANLDRKVSLLDLNTLGSNFGNAGGWGDGDFNGDGQVSLLDLNTLGTTFGFDNSAAVPAVPEPASLVLLGLSGLALMRRRS